MRYLTAGESHGPCLTGIIEGLPSGLPLTAEDINRQLARRQQGFGRGGRMAIEKDKVKILAGLRFGKTLGSPLTLQISNRDWANWQDIMSGEGSGTDEGLVTAPRPGHADLPGGIKYRRCDLRDILERASARETAMRVAVGAVARALIGFFGLEIAAHVVAIGSVESRRQEELTVEEIRRRSEASPVRCIDPAAAEQMILAIQEARRQGDSLGGIFEVIVAGVPPGLGSHVHWDRRLDGRLAGSLMSLQGIKGVEIGAGFNAARLKGSEVHDAIYYQPGRGVHRLTNRAGGLEGGITNGEPLVLRAAMKPIPTLYRSLPSVDLKNKETVRAAVERSDVCAVAAAAVVGEAIVAWELAVSLREKLGGDSLEEMERAFTSYKQYYEDYLG